MKIEEAFTVAVPIERMYAEINNIGEMGYCIAGVQRVEVLSEIESRWTIEAKAGFMARVFKLDGRITERRPPSFFGFAGTGQDVEVTGSLELEAVDPAKTKCRAVIEAEVTGGFKTIVELMAKGPQQQLIRQTIANVHERLEAVAKGGGEAEGTPAGGADVLVGSGDLRPTAPSSAGPEPGLVIRLPEIRVPEWAPLALAGAVLAGVSVGVMVYGRRRSVLRRTAR